MERTGESFGKEAISEHLPRSRWSHCVPETLRQNSKWRPQFMGPPSTLRGKGVCPLQDLDLQCQSPDRHSSRFFQIFFPLTSANITKLSSFFFKGLSLGLHPPRWPPRSPRSFYLTFPWREGLYSPLFPLFFKPLSLLLSHHFCSCSDNLEHHNHQIYQHSPWQLSLHLPVIAAFSLNSSPRVSSMALLSGFL